MEQLINFIIRPPRAEYDPKEDLLDQKFKLRGKLYIRRDFEVVNNLGKVLQCSHYMPDIHPGGIPLPCVIYCHGNSGCRMDASEAAVILLPSNITVFAFDFSGSGLSGGEHVTLGWNEKADLRAVVDHLRADGKVSMIGLWGRSMGAVTSLMYAAEDPSIAGMVLDSPFSDLIDLMMELVDSYKVRLPKFTVKFLIQYIRRAIQKKVKFDIVDLNAVKAAKSCFVPALFGHAIEDDFIRPHHSDIIFDAYPGDKNIIRFEGDHNSPRPQFYFDSISIFFNNVLQPPPDDELAPLYVDLNEDEWDTVPDLEDVDGLGSSSDGTAAAAAKKSTGDAMEQSCSKKPVENEPSASSSSSTNVLASEPSKVSSHHGCDMADFPINVEEEERMIVEAVVKSLKDLERRHPHDESSSDGPGDLPKLINAPMNGQEDHCAVAESRKNLERGSQDKESSSEGPGDPPELPSTPTNRQEDHELDSSSTTAAEAASHSRENEDSTSSLLPSDMLSDVDMAGRSSATSEDDKSSVSGCDGGCMIRCLDIRFFKNR